MLALVCSLAANVALLGVAWWLLGRVGDYRGQSINAEHDAILARGLLRAHGITPPKPRGET